MRKMSDKPWYSDGLRFECTQCGNCCTGAPGYVWVNEAEMKAIAEVIGEKDLDQFERLYTRKVGVRKTLKEYPNGDCVFFDPEKRGCTVYDARPRQCRSWPFWDSNLRREENWKETCENCPGAGKGKLYSIEHIDEQRKMIRI